MGAARGPGGRAAGNTLFRAGGGLTTLLPNLIQDNLLTGSSPFVMYPKLIAAPGNPVPFGIAVTSDQLPAAYTTGGARFSRAGDSKLVPGNTQMDVLRFERELAANLPGHQILPLSMQGMTPGFSNGYIATWTVGLEQKAGGATIAASYVGTAGVKLAAIDFLNGYFGAGPGFAPYTQFEAAGNITGGYAPKCIHDKPLALYLPRAPGFGRAGSGFSGPGFQASYTFGKSIDDSSGDRRLHLRVLGRGLADGSARPLRRGWTRGRLRSIPSRR